jgi:hypothetical protein
LVEVEEHEGRQGITGREAETAIREPRGSGSHDARLTTLRVPDMDRLRMHVSTGTGQLRGVIGNNWTQEARDKSGRWQPGTKVKTIFGHTLDVVDVV